MDRTEILLATYNGAPYLGELLASLDAQTDQNWVLTARDDSSTDDTLSILRAWGARRPGRFRLIEDDRANLGPSGNFGALLEASEADCFLPCDQDDAWLPDKVARLKAAMRRAETESGRDAPIIVHTDLTVADARLRPLSRSFWHHQRLTWPDPETPWKVLALQNVVTGCAMIGNAALREAALPIPAEAMMHDWWLSLVAASMGRIIDDPEPSVLYRQHGGNTLGAKSWGMRNALIWVSTGPIRAARRANFILHGTRRQARYLVERFANRLYPEAHRYLAEYGHLAECGLLQRKSFPARHRLWFGDPIRNAGLLLCI